MLINDTEYYLPSEITCEIVLSLDIFNWKCLVLLIDRDLQRKISQFRLILLNILTYLKELFCANAHAISCIAMFLHFCMCIAAFSIALFRALVQIKVLLFNIM